MLHQVLRQGFVYLEIEGRQKVQVVSLLYVVKTLTQ